MARFASSKSSRYRLLSESPFAAALGLSIVSLDIYLSSGVYIVRILIIKEPTLDSKDVGPLRLINRCLDRLRAHHLFGQCVPRGDRRQKAAAVTLRHGQPIQPLIGYPLRFRLTYRGVFLKHPWLSPSPRIFATASAPFETRAWSCPGSRSPRSP
jgi:hypothetical protein